MLAKAVYEGICIDICLAPVLLASILDKQLCPFDELATLDPLLYRNLTYVKHYAESADVADLELTFSCDQELLGRVHTVELISSGQNIKVTNENKARFKIDIFLE
jgi:ubiquitin-protein ligase E3 B